MRSSLPDELFRGRPSPSGEPRDAPAPPRSSSQGPGVKLRSSRPGASRRVAVIASVAAIVVGFLSGRVLRGPDTPATVPTPVVSAPAPPSASAPPTLVPYDGPVKVLPALDADGVCAPGTTDEPPNLVDSNPNTIWRCPGPGVGEELTFTLPQQPFVGVRVVNGNTQGLTRYQAERRILSVKWTFPDGSWVVQGMAGNDRRPQELRFPPVTVDGPVRLTILDVTVPGEAGEDSDAVALGSVAFLTIA